MIGLVDLVSVYEVAQILGVSRQRVYQLIAKGGFPDPVATLAVGRIWIREDIERWAGQRGCQHRRCVNPLHLEPVTPAENNQRAKRDTCRKGHPWTPESTIVRTATGGRECRICSRERHQAARLRRKDVA